LVPSAGFTPSYKKKTRDGAPTKVNPGRSEQHEKRTVGASC